MTDAYHHTQRAPLYLLLYVLGLGMILVGWLLRDEPSLVIVLPATGAFFLLFGSTFQSLTVADQGDHLAIRFGPIPLFRRRIRYDKMRAVEVGRTMVAEGWGIHMSHRGGWVWNLWGRDCVVIHYDNSVIRVGTDDPENLAEFLRSRIGVKV